MEHEPKSLVLLFHTPSERSGDRTVVELVDARENVIGIRIIV